MITIKYLDVALFFTYIIGTGYKVVLVPKARKQLLKTGEDRASILSKLKLLENWPDTALDIKALKSRHDYRLRVGRWRVLFLIHAEYILVTEVKKRDDNTY